MDSLKISIENREYFCNLRISKRARYIRLQYCSEKGLELIVPYGVPVSEAEAFARTKEDWIAKYITLPQSALQKYYFLGECLSLRHEYDLFAKKTIVKLEDSTLSILSPEGSKSDARAIYQHWLARKAKQYIPDRTSYLASLHGFRTGRISIKGQKTRWGSCSRLGNLTFNYKLMAYGTDIIDYVIVHELCHLKELNHSKRFWRLVEEILPNYKELRKELRNIK